MDLRLILLIKSEATFFIRKSTTLLWMPMIQTSDSTSRGEKSTVTSVQTNN
ncbi:hypothetical protein O9929_04600 [Vibrio lentus]|nr:hypothetical protein [Vibrio lentus]